MPITFIQIADAGQGHFGATSLTATYTDAQIAGNCNIIGSIEYAGFSAIDSVTDSSGNVYTKVPVTSSASTSTITIWYCAEIVEAAAFTNVVTITYSGATTATFFVAEYSGIDPTLPLDGTAQIGSSFGGTGATVPLTTTNANDLIIAVCGDDTGHVHTPGAGYTSRDALSTGVPGGIFMDQIVSETGSFDGSNTFANQTWSEVTVAFVAAAVAVAPTVTAQAAASIDYQSETLNGTLTDDGGAAITAYGFNVGLTTAYGTTVSVAETLASGDTFALPATGLAELTTYHFRSFATNSAGTSVSADRTFTTVARPVVGNSFGTLTPCHVIT